MGEQPKIYTAEKLTFIVVGDKIVIRTKIGQQFYLLPKQHYWLRRIRLIRAMIELNEVRNLNELSEWCGNGIDWVTTSQQYSKVSDDVLV